MESHQISDGGDCVWGPSHRQLGPAMLAEYPGKVLHSFGLTRELWLHCRLCKRGLLDNLSLLDNVYIRSSQWKFTISPYSWEHSRGLDSVGLENDENFVWKGIPQIFFTFHYFYDLVFTACVADLISICRCPPPPPPKTGNNSAFTSFLFLWEIY